MLNKFSISGKLYLLIFITAASLIGLGLYGIGDLKKMNDNTRTLYADRVICIQQLSNIRRVYSRDIRSVPQNVKRHELSFSEAIKRIRQAQEIIDTNWYNYKRTNFTPEEKLLVKQTDALKSKADEANKDLIAALSKEDTLAINKLVQQENPAESTPFAIKVTQLMDLQVRVAKEVLINNTKLYQVTSRNFFLLILLSLAIVLPISFLIIKNIRNLIRDLVKGRDLIKESEKRYRTILENASDAIYLVNNERCFIEANDGMCKMLGYSKDELLQLKIEEVFDNEQLKTDPVDLPLIPYHSTFKQKKFIRKDGTTVEVEIHGRRIDENKWMGVARDITERKKAQELILKEKELSETIINSLPGIFYLRNEQGKLVRWNKNVEQVLGYTTQEIERLTVRDLIDNEDHPIVNIASEKVFKEGYATAEARLVTKDGTRIPFLLTGSPVMYENQLCLLGTGIDISSRIKAEELLRESEANLRSIFDATDISYLLLDADFNIIALNQNMVDVYRDNAGVMLKEGENLVELIHYERRQKMRELYSNVLKSKKPGGYEVSLSNTGFTRHFAASVIPIVIGNAAVGLCISSIDITERKNALEKLEETNASLQKHARKLAISNAELEQFAYVASHDLQEPLRMVTSFMTQLEKKYGDVVDDRGRQYIHFAVDGAKRMRRIILDLLDFSRVGKTEDDLEQVNFNKLVDEVLALFRRKIEEVNASINFEKLPVVQTYKTPVRQVFQNLLDNSLKYHKAGVPAIINISCEETKTHFQFAVKDNGIGIDSAYFDKIFIIFQRLHNKDEYSGTGMGLAITKKIIENLGGKIWVESEEGEGSIFYFTLLKNIRS